MSLSRLKFLSDKLWLSNPNFIFLLSLAVFVTDSAINLFWNIPVFVPFIILILPLLWFDLLLEHKLQKFIIWFSLVFVGSFLISGFIYGWHRQSFSDLLFILFFITSYYYYQAKAKRFSKKNVHVFTLVIFVMFSFAFFGINSDSYTDDAEPISSTEVTAKKKVAHNNEELDVLEYTRNYNYGIFRIPHIATYMMGFIGLFYAFLYYRERKWFFVVISGIAFLLMFYSGVRTYFAAMLLAMMLFFVRRKTLWVVLGFGLLGLLIVIFRYPFYKLTHSTLLEPFSSLVITMTDNIDRLSRILIWRSWWLELRQFNWYNYLVGKTYYSSIEANIQNLNIPIWFHNDFLSIIYSYGLIGLGFYILFFVKMYKAFSKQIKGNFFIFVFFASMPFAAFINGMYYYFPVFVLFLYFIMINTVNGDFAESNERNVI